MNKKYTRWLITLLISSFLYLHSANGTERIGRLGIGLTNQIKNGLPALSFKMQKSRSLSFGGMFNIDTSSTGGWGAGIKLYKNIFEEPQANFYSSVLAAITNTKQTAGGGKTGFQIDATFGSEFSFTGLTSLGFSFEAGVSFNKVDDFAIQTVGNGFVTGSIHFYL